MERPVDTSVARANAGVGPNERVSVDLVDVFSLDGVRATLIGRSIKQ